MVGYPEALTDPSYHGQILTLTYPLVGNYGVPPYEVELGIPRHFESENIKAAALIVHELCVKPHHWASTRTLDQWLSEEGVPGMYGIDTRRLTKKLRGTGVMLGILQTCENSESFELGELVEEAQRTSNPNAKDLVKEITVKEPIIYKSGKSKTIVLVDCGVKSGIIRYLVKKGLDIIRVPCDFSAKEIVEYNPKGVVVSNGPGDPKKCEKTIQSVRELSEENIPLMGICLGTQILALAMGGNTYKMKYGHRSQNQPALDLETDRCYITTQNHGYAIAADSLANTKLKPWFINANDKTIEGIRHENGLTFAVQFHPEASPGPYDTDFLFDCFVKSLKG